ncbi:MAG: twin-arginine translocation signal domain-containing protein [Planctomycetes bacterium]|nr:twin-arginine translocation signal domain-containing protein [Planctomycetota bacterium]
MSYRSTRRSFLKHVAVAGAALPWAMPRLVRAASPNTMLNHIAFGANGMAKSDISSLSRHPSFKLIAACDVDSTRLDYVKGAFKDVQFFSDWREVFDKLGDKFDSCNVTVPDHSHAPIAMTAIHHGKHVYCQKPLCHEIYEVRKVTEAAAKAGVVTQMGIQIHSSIYYRMAVAIVQSGGIGKVKEIHSWSGKKWGDNGARPNRSDPVPDTLNWDVWLGVGPQTDFIGGGYFHPGQWRKRLDFGTGTFGDMGCHIYDPIYNAAALTAPVSLTSLGPKPSEYNWGINAHIKYVFPGTQYTESKTVNVTWYDGDMRPPKEVTDLVTGRGIPGQGSIIVGTEGTMLLPHIERPFLYPVDKYKDYAYPKLEGQDHWLQFVDACTGTGKTSAGFDYAGPLTESVLLGGVATRFPNETIEWDAPSLSFKNKPEATALIRRTYRKGWNIPGLSD